jgi:hypothetical protein
MKAEGILQIPFMRTAMRELISQGGIRLPQLEPADGKKELAQDIALLESTVADTSNQAQASSIIQMPFLKSAVRELIKDANIRLPRMDPEDGGNELYEDIELL